MTQDNPTLPAAPPAVAKDPNDRRRVRRRRVLKEGKVIFGKGHSVVDCVIDNESQTGAHVRISSSHGVPQDFYLCEATRGVIHKVEVAWRTTVGLGLKIQGPIDDTTTREALLRRFRRG